MSLYQEVSWVWQKIWVDQLINNSIPVQMLEMNRTLLVLRAFCVTDIKEELTINSKNSLIHDLMTWIHLQNRWLNMVNAFISGGSELHSEKQGHLLRRGEDGYEDTWFFNSNSCEHGIPSLLKMPSSVKMLCLHVSLPWRY